MRPRGRRSSPHAAFGAFGGRLPTPAPSASADGRRDLGGLRLRFGGRRLRVGDRGRRLQRPSTFGLGSVIGLVGALAALPRRAVRRIASSAASSLLPPSAVSAGIGVEDLGQRRPGASSSPLISSASSSTKRSMTRERETTSTSSRLSSTRVSPSRIVRLRRSWRTVTSSTSGASPASSRTSARASDAGHSSGRRSDRPGPRAPRVARRRPAPFAAGERLDRDDRARPAAEPDREAGLAPAPRRRCRRSGPRAAWSARRRRR